MAEGVGGELRIVSELAGLFTAPFHRDAVIDEGPSRRDIISSRRTPNLDQANPPPLSIGPLLPPPRQADIIIILASPTARAQPLLFPRPVDANGKHF